MPGFFNNLLKVKKSVGTIMAASMLILPFTPFYRSVSLVDDNEPLAAGSRYLSTGSGNPS